MQFRSTLSVIPLLTILLPACSGDDGKNGSSCSVKRTSAGATIVCDDGTSVTIDNGSVGATGPAGHDGTNGFDGSPGATGPTGAAGVSATPTLMAANRVATSAGCVAGGIEISIGADDNGNGILDTSEIDSTSVLCDGATGPVGATGLTGATGAIGPTGTIGPTGASGATGPVGAIGPTGATGATGPMGPAGATGATGSAATNSLMLVTKELPGTNCVRGGQKIEVGLDDNGNGQLDAGEVDNTSYACSPATCQVTFATIKLSPVVDTSINYLNGNTFGDDILRAYSYDAVTSDYVGWMGFDLSDYGGSIPIYGMRLFMWANSQYSSPMGTPSVQVVYSSSNGFPRTGATTVELPRTQAVSTVYSGFVASAWFTFAIDITARDFGDDFADGWLSLGVDEVAGGYRYAYFDGIDYTTTKPYLEVDTMLCQ